MNGRTSHAIACLLAFAVMTSVTPLAAQTDAFSLRADVRTVGPRVDVRALAHDRHGFLWTASEGGVCRFDGVQWSCPVTQSARFVTPNPDGAVWMALDDDRIAYLPAGGRAVRHLTGPGKPTGLTSGAAGDVLLGTTEGLFWLQENASVWGPSPMASGRVTAVVSAADGTLLAAIERRVLRVAATRVIELWQAPESIRALHPLRGRELGVVLGSGTVWAVALDAPAKAHPVALPPNPDVRAMQADGHGRLWIGARDSLLYLQHDKAILSAFDFSATLPTYQVNALHADVAGNLWVGTTTGVVQLRFDHPFQTIGANAGLPAPDMVFALAEPRPGELWFTTLKGVAHWDGQRATLHDRAAGLDSPDLRSITVDAAGDLWVGGIGSGLFKQAQGRFVPVLDENGKRAPGVRALRPRRQGGVWVGLFDGGLAVVERDRLRIEIPTQGTRRDRVMDMFEATDGTLWLALSGDGLVARRGSELRRFGAEHGIPAVDLLALLPSADGALWIGSDGKGLLRFDGQSAKRVTTEQGLASDRVFSLLTDRTGQAWMSFARGLSRFSLTDVERVMAGQETVFTSLTFGPDDGVTAEPVRAFPSSALALADGTLMYPTVRGPLQVVPDLIKPDGPGAVVIDEIAIDGRHVNASEAIVTTITGSAELDIRFAVPTLSNAHRIWFRHRLEGTDPVWRDDQQARHLHLERLPPGHHRLRIQAYDRGVRPLRAVETTLAFVLKPAWYATVWVRAGLVVAITLTLLGLHRWRTQRLEQAHAAILAERGRIAHEIHDGIEQDLAGLRMQIDAARIALSATPDKARSHLDRAGLLIGDAITDLRSAIWDIQGADTDSAMLGDELSQRLARAVSGTGVEIAVEVTGPSRRLGAELARHITAITREAVANALKHAAPTRIQIKLDTSHGSDVSLEIVDDGVGLLAGKHPAPGHGLGVAGMHARAGALAASLTIAPSPGGGTRISLRVPLARS